MQSNEPAAGGPDASAPASGEGSGSAPPGSDTGPATLVSVEWLEGNDQTITTAPGRQWVNLPDDDADWVDNDMVRSVDRLGRTPRVKVWFSRPGAHPFKLRLFQEGDQDIYTSQERGRNARFGHTTGERMYTTDSNGTKIVESDFELPVAGGFRWRIRGIDQQGNEQFTQWLESRRLLYYIVIRMRGVPAVRRSGYGNFERVIERYGIEARRLANATMRRFSNIDVDGEDPVLDAARSVYERNGGERKEPHLLTFIFTDQLAVKNARRALGKDGVMGGPGNIVDLPIQGLSLRTPRRRGPHPLWIDIDDEDWFVRARFRTAGGSMVNIPRERCSPVFGSNGSYADVVRIDLSDCPAEVGTVLLRVNWVDRMRGGLSLSGGNAIVIATRAWWRNSPHRNQIASMVHEAGHKLHMVSTGGTQPTRHSNQYSGCGHVGSHCHTGMSARSDYRGQSSNADCVMFGTIHGDARFCVRCGQQVKKVDICSGWTGF